MPNKIFVGGVPITVTEAGEGRMRMDRRIDQVWRLFEVFCWGFCWCFVDGRC